MMMTLLKKSTSGNHLLSQLVFTGALLGLCFSQSSSAENRYSDEESHANVVLDDILSSTKHEQRRQLNVVKEDPGAPILVMGLPQTMDRALANYFRCGNNGLRVSQWTCRPGEFCGKMIHDNVEAGQPPLQDTGDFDVYASLGVIDPNGSNGCFFPQISALEEIHKAYPTATFVLNYHTNVRDWLALLRQSDDQDHRGSSGAFLHERLVQCDIPPLKASGQGTTDEELEDFYWAHLRRVKEFVAEKGNTHKIVEVDVDSVSAGYTLQGAFGTSSDCWEHAVEIERQTKAKSLDEQGKNAEMTPVFKHAPAQVSSFLRSNNNNSDKKSPILVMGMPKAGTSSVTEFFRCGGLQVSHWTCPTGMKEQKSNEDPGGRMEFCGEIIKDNIERGRPPLENTGDFDVYAQMDTEFAWGRDLCFLPQLQALDELHHHYPDAPIVLNVRAVDRWISSVHRWKPKKHKDHRTMGERLAECDLPFLPKGKGQTEEELREFYAKAYKHIADFVRSTGDSHKLVIVDVQSPYAGHVLEDAFGIDKSCWGNFNSNPVADTSTQ